MNYTWERITLIIMAVVALFIRLDGLPFVAGLFIALGGLPGWLVLLRIAMAERESGGGE